MALDIPLRRKSIMLKWLSEFGFATTSILASLGITHNDLTSWREEGLIISIKTTWRPLRGRAPTAIWVWRFTKAGCRLANKQHKRKCRLSADRDLPTRSLSHDLLNQAAVIVEMNEWGVSEGGRVTGTTEIEINNESFRPDSIISTSKRRVFIEMEKSSSIKRREKGLNPELGADLFIRKIDCLTQLGDVIIWTWTKKQAEDLSRRIDRHRFGDEPYSLARWINSGLTRMLHCSGETVWKGQGEIIFRWVQKDDEDYGESGIWMILPHPNRKSRTDTTSGRILLDLPKLKRRKPRKPLPAWVAVKNRPVSQEG